MASENIKMKKKVKSKYTIQEAELYSFDIFDTLITRRTFTPFGIFAIMQKKLNEDLQYQSIPSILKNNFYEKCYNKRYYRYIFYSICSMGYYV